MNLCWQHRLVGAFAITAFLLTGCSQPTGKPFAIDNIIADVAMEPAHQEERCSKGCYYIPVPDTWYIHFCDVKDSADCAHRAIRHAPWGWEKVGHRVTITWQRWSDDDLTIVSIVDDDTKEKLDL